MHKYMPRLEQSKQEADFELERLDQELKLNDDELDSIANAFYESHPYHIEQIDFENERSAELRKQEEEVKRVDLATATKEELDGLGVISIERSNGKGGWRQAIASIFRTPFGLTDEADGIDTVRNEAFLQTSGDAVTGD